MGKVMGAWSWAQGITLTGDLQLEHEAEFISLASGNGQSRKTSSSLGMGSRGAWEAFLPPQPSIWGCIQRWRMRRGNRCS